MNNKEEGRVYGYATTCSHYSLKSQLKGLLGKGVKLDSIYIMEEYDFVTDFLHNDIEGLCQLERGDTLVVFSISCFSSFLEMVDEMFELGERGIFFESIKEPYFNIMSATDSYIYEFLKLMARAEQLIMCSGGFKHTRQNLLGSISDLFSRKEPSRPVGIKLDLNNKE